MNKYSAKLDTIENLIKQAQWKKAQESLLALRKKRVPDEFRLRFATLCRRANVSDLGLSILKEIVRPDGKKKAFGTDAHRAEYAASLVRVGACREAEKLFESVDLEACPEAVFFKAGLFVKVWNYSDAIPLYRRYLVTQEEGSYTYLVGQINLAMCLIFEGEYDEAARHINAILVSEGDSHWTLIKGNAYRMLGGLEVHRGNYDAAMTAFYHAQRIFTDAEGIDRFLIRKWVALINYFLAKGSDSARNGVLEVRKEAEKRKHWESVRDIDFQLACFDGDHKTLVKLYFGTPFESFKKRLLKRNPELQIPNVYYWDLDPMEKGHETTFDLFESGIKPGQSIFRLLQVLLSDFYRSFGIVDLFESTFPGEFYISGSAEERVYQALKRLRKEFIDRKIPLTIESTDGGFRLVGTKPVRILCGRGETSSKTQADHRLEQLRHKFQKGSFGVTDAVDTLGLSKRTVNALINDGMEKGVLAKSGSGNRIQYQFVEGLEFPLKKAG